MIYKHQYGYHHHLNQTHLNHQLMEQHQLLRNLDILLEDKMEEENFYKGCFLNAKGFGGNNASAFILSPEETQIKMESLVTKNKYNQYLKNIGETRKKSSQYNKSCLKGDYQVTYKFNENVLNGETDIEISRKGMKLKGFKKPIKF